MFYIYILRCIDNTLYTGYTTDVKKRFETHKQMLPQSAKYTRAHPVKCIEAVWSTASKGDAMSLEYMIKKYLDRSSKEKIIKNPNLIFEILSDKISGKEYKYEKEFLE